SYDSRFNQDDIARIMGKVEAVIKPYIETSEKYWHAEEEIFINIKAGPRKKLINNIIHSHEILEQIDVQADLSRLLFASPDYLTSHFLVKGEIDLRPEITRLERMRFLVSKWDSMLFESIGLKVTDYQVEVAKKNVIAEIQKWIFMNPRASYSAKSRLKWEPYVKERFSKFGQIFTKENLIPHYELISTINIAIASRIYKDYSVSSRKTLDYSTEAIKTELGIKRHFYSSLKEGGFFTQKTLENVFIKVCNWHQDEFGDVISGLHYDRSDSYARNQLFQYQDVLYKIKEYADARGITLFDGRFSTALVEIEGTSYKIMDIIDKDYDNNFRKQAYKEFHLLFQLAKYIGFDPLTFTPLKDSDMASSRYQLHHFLAEWFRKMSSNVADIVLTNINLHGKYEKMLRDKGKEGEAYIRALMKTVQDLIQKDVVNIKKEHIQESLIENLGRDEGMFIYHEWTKDQLTFRDNLNEFNKRRSYAKKGDYKGLLTSKYGKTWKNRAQNAYLYISKEQSKYALFFSYKVDLEILYKIFPFKSQASLEQFIK
ncbi:MAG: hypothetical protein ACFFG0_14220, partial [Candidatus Thorarchaeota archaeon]